jgi:sterol desaturase/sphingolipid hydroxylase (fatty acid hydroxylase superfamily)
MGGPVALWTILSPALIVAGALTLIVLERWRPYDGRQKLFRPGLATDLVGYAFIQSYLLGLVITHLSAWLDGTTGLSRLHLVSGWPVAAQLGFFVLTHDLYIYLFHRLQHHSMLLWRIHEAHHATADVDWLSGARSHALEILVNQTIEFAPLVLLGAAPEVALMKVTLDSVWGMYIHSNIDIRSGWLQRFINGPEMHRWHHAVEIVRDVNFSTKFAFWDWLLGTAYLPSPTAPYAKPEGYGLWNKAPFPVGFLGQQAWAFRAPAPGLFETIPDRSAVEASSELKVSEARRAS